ncbi:hypothetical protein F53441_13388 [Fusarium austroafricanum]|uniref:Acyltransferase n=1 Tax=Fusarium austroafricanum TaxID=2364996 RepID=A0A8H4JNB1_9HYPO|nr:hypothetical protein F53441_13388 [Fusarium austroafricanum]
MSSNDMSFPWKEISPGNFRQPLDSFGRIWSTFYHTDAKYGREPVCIASYVKFNTTLEAKDLETNLRDAWKATRYFNPGIACAVDEFYREYKIPSQDEVDSWMLETFKTQLSKTPEEIIKNHTRDFHPVLHFFPAKDGNTRHELVILSNHMFNDARGEFYFWNSFFELVTTPEAVTFGDESKYLPPARDDLLGLPPSPSVPSYGKAMSLIGSAFVPDPVRTPLRPSNEASDGGCIKRLALSESQTTKLVDACKLKGVSVTAAVKAAHILTLRGLQGASDGNYRDECFGFEMMDPRSAFKRSYNPSQSIGTDYHILMPTKFSLGDNKTFLDVAKDMTTSFRTIREDFNKDAEGLDALGYVMLQALTTPPEDPIPPIFSSLGIVDDFMKSNYGGSIVGIEDIWVVVPVNSGTYNGLWVWTWRGQLHLLTSFNKGCYSTEMMEKALQTIVDALLEGLNIE